MCFSAQLLAGGALTTKRGDNEGGGVNERLVNQVMQSRTNSCSSRHDAHARLYIVHLWIKWTHSPSTGAVACRVRWWKRETGVCLLSVPLIGTNQLFIRFQFLWCWINDYQYAGSTNCYMFRQTWYVSCTISLSMKNLLLYVLILLS